MLKTSHCAAFENSKKVYFLTRNWPWWSQGGQVHTSKGAQLGAVSVRPAATGAKGGKLFHYLQLVGSAYTETHPVSLKFVSRASKFSVIRPFQSI
jgi:hypothetical protein